MSDTDQLRDLGQQLAAALVASYGATAPGSKLVFLPGGVSVPNDIVQSGPSGLMVNPAQMQTWLSINFDAPFVVSGAEGSVLERDSSHGSVSRIYTLAASMAQPLGNPGDADWTRVNYEIAAAQRSLGPPDAPKLIVCEPDNWLVPTANAGYWSKFDSSETQTSSPQTAMPVPVVNPRFWMVRSLAAEPIASVDHPAPVIPRQRFKERAKVPPSRFIAERAAGYAGDPAVPLVSPSLTTVAIAASSVQATNLPGVETASKRPELRAWRVAADHGEVPQSLNAHVIFETAPPINNITTASSSTVKIHLEHQCVALGYFSADQPWWDGVFLADQGWFIPGMPQGGLLPAPGGTGVLAYGLPTAMIIVQNLRLSGKWSAEAAAVLRSPGGTVGPLSLFGAEPSTDSDGVVTYGHDGMQVVALLCSAIPILPPVHAPLPPI